MNFDKAFDTLEWEFIVRTIRYYNFGDSLITWVKLCYADISIQNLLHLTRGVKTRIPFIPITFTSCVEILGSVIENHDHIKGIRVLSTECKLSQNEHDTKLILDGSANSKHQSFSLQLFLR